MVSYDEVLVIGYGSVAGDVLSHVHKMSGKYGYEISYVEHEIHAFNKAKLHAESNKIDFYIIENKAELEEFFKQRIKEKRFLIISAGNNYIFPNWLIEDENSTIINYHNALLPDFPGRNATSWAIYEKAPRTGITWHYVSSGIDEGDIIIQKSCDISDDIKAYELLAKQIVLAKEAFEECFENVLENNIIPVKQKMSHNRRIYKSDEVPGNGRFNIEDSVSDIYRLLRAMDYGKYGIFPLPITSYEGRDIIIKKYSIKESRDIKYMKERIYLPYKDEKKLILKYIGLQ